MNKTYFISDLHLGDANIIKYEGRPFRDVDDMNSTIMANWNSTADSSDTIFVVGDFISDISYFDILTKLNGKIKLIVGNHDVPFIEEYRKYPNVEVIEYPIIFKGFWMVSHEPMYVTQNAPYANIFGHIHNNPMYLTVSSRSYCVCVERNGYQLIDFEYIVKCVMKENK